METTQRRPLGRAAVEAPAARPRLPAALHAARARATVAHQARPAGAAASAVVPAALCPARVGLQNVDDSAAARVHAVDADARRAGSLPPVAARVPVPLKERASRWTQTHRKTIGPPEPTQASGEPKSEPSQINSVRRIGCSRGEALLGARSWRSRSAISCTRCDVTPLASHHFCPPLTQVRRMQASS